METMTERHRTSIRHDVKPSISMSSPVLPTNDTPYSLGKVFPSFTRFPSYIDAISVSSRSSTLMLVMIYVLPGAMAVICFIWTIWLFLLTIKPNDTVNWVMNTENFDNGSLWLLIDPPIPMMLLSLCGLSLVAISYATVLAKLFMPQKSVSQMTRSSRVEFIKAKSTIRRANNRQGRLVTMLLVQVASCFVKDYSVAVTIARVWTKFIDLAVETALLWQNLESGSPPVLVTTFSSIIGLNALSCAIMMYLPDGQTGLIEILIDTTFDFLVAVGYPILTVIYCLSSFKLDRFKLNINLEVFPIGWFERDASVTADPVQTDIIYKSLKSLQILTPIDFLIRIGLSFVFSYRLYNVVGLVRDPKKRPTRFYPKHNHTSTVLLFAFVIVMVIFVEESIRTSDLACKPHPECAVKAHRWTNVESGSLTQCPCLTLIDVDLAPKSYIEWMQPQVVTDKVAQLATTGDLRTIQLINRYVPVIPDELQRCKHLRRLTLIYTYTETMPTWIKEFTYLEYLYVEGTFTTSLVELPDDIFDDMVSLTFIHLGMHFQMQKLPSFKGLTNLKVLTLAIFFSLIELPVFDSLTNLERLLLITLPNINSLPDLKALDKLKSFIVNDRGGWCCNGFLGECNLKNSFCGALPALGIPPVSSCLNSTDLRANNETLAVISKFSSTVCRESKSKILTPGLPTPELVAQCGGILYRRCHVPGYEEAMCYNNRFMVISCDPGPLAIEMRRRQIQESVGDPCHPEYEAWLGCK